MNERRRAPRFPVHGVKGTLLLTTSATIVNMSLGGMAVESATNLRVGRTYRLQLQRGDSPGPVLEGRVAWCHLEGSRKSETGEVTAVFRAGIEFAGVLGEKAVLLLAFLRESAIVTPQERLTGRFGVRPTNSVDLGTELEFAVKTISATGMLVETALAPEPGAVVDMLVQLDGNTVAARARVAFLRDVGEEEKRLVTAVGVEFLDMPARDRATLDQFLAQQVARG